MSKESKFEQLLGEKDLKDKLKSVPFEDGMQTLEELVTKVESGALALDKAVRSYEVGSALVEHLRGLLNGAEAKLKILQKGPDGTLSVKEG